MYAIAEYQQSKFWHWHNSLKDRPLLFLPVNADCDWPSYRDRVEMGDVEIL